MTQNIAEIGTGVGAGTMLGIIHLLGGSRVIQHVVSGRARMCLKEDDFQETQGNSCRIL